MLHPVLFAALVALMVARAPAAEVKIGFLGPKGSYSDEAATAYAARVGLSETTPLNSITEVAQFVRDERAELGLLPFENSIGGFVGETQLLLLGHEDPGWRVISDVSIPIRNNLLVKPGAKASDLTKIVSHPAALKECAHWLAANLPQVALEEANSTAAAAERAAKGDGTIAAIASSAAARVYQLQILFPNIQDDQRNATTFLVIQAAKRDWREQNPTRLIVRVDAVKGEDRLSRLIEELHHLTFTLTDAGSAPTGTLDSYRFELIFDAKSGASLERIQAILRPSGALLIGAYRPSAVEK